MRALRGARGAVPIETAKRKRRRRGGEEERKEREGGEAIMPWTLAVLLMVPMAELLKEST